MSVTKHKVVVIGGGNGAALTLRALKKYTDELEIKAVISMSDSGGSTGRLRREFNTLPAGDILRAVLALSAHDADLLKEIFYRVRFIGAGKLDRHNLGNLFLVLAQQYDGNWPSAIRALEQAVAAQGRVYPATLDSTDLVVELSDGEKIKGEGVIDRPEYDRSRRIARAYLEPEGKVFPEAANVMAEADYILFGPGSLYCSIVAALLPAGAKEAIKKSKAKLIYVIGNAYENIGETGPVKLSEFAQELENYLPRPLDLVVYNDHELDVAQRDYYLNKNWSLIEADLENIDKSKLVQGGYEKKEGGLDAEKLGNILRTVIYN